MAGYLLALTGASGAAYGLRIAGELLSRGDDVELVISPSGFIILKEELGIECGEADAPERIGDFLKRYGRPLRGRLRLVSHKDLAASAASGSSLVKAMIVCPCSMGTLGRIAAGISGNIIERAADCMLKERRPLVLVPRETPLSTIHLRNMLGLSEAGAIILPAMPAFYHKPDSIDGIVDFVAGKVLDVLGIENNLFKRWKKEGD
ncbi:MAG: UbiX family flavin prenyltransferase [Deltaproteobacteria bacterium]|nr:UbiX family flavin prenyltransferase [Deltaproteobacteria bacterium]MCL4873584.1 UbiX family flavin prenyltransferase [bacterium]